MAMQDRITKLAHGFYLTRNPKENKALEDWLRAEKVVVLEDRFFKFVKHFIRHPLFLIVISGIFIWVLQQQYIRSQELVRMRFETMKKISPVYASYYQETWNQWYALQNKQPSEEYRRNIQHAVIEAKAIETELPLLFSDRKISEDWKEILNIFRKTNYPVSREAISEQQLNERLNPAAPILDDILNRMHREVRPFFKFVNL